MNLSLIRLIDSKIGRPVCNYLYYYDKFRALFPPMQRFESTLHRILIIKFWGIGNLVQASPTLRAIRERFPDSEIIFLTLQQNKGIYEDSGLYDRAIYLRLTTVWDFTRELFKLFFFLRSFGFNLIINLEPLAYFGELISFYVGVGDRVGYAIPGRKSLFTKQIEFKEDEHIARTFYRTLKAIGIEEEPTEEQLLPTPIPIKREAVRAAEALLRAEDISESEFIIGINVNASDVAVARRWPLENFAELVDMVIQKYGARVLMFGAPDELPYVERAIAMMRKTPVNFAGRTSLREMIALLDKADLFITNDSGPLHLAYAVGTSTISLFGPESPLRYGPIGNKHVALFKNLDCSPCINFKNLKRSECHQEARCMKEISVSEVLTLVEEAHRQWQEQGEIVQLAEVA
jgi:lipopolysaccharide heptosyltransferase II